MFDSLLLRDQVVFITGASRGIGRQVALTCAQSGATVVAKKVINLWLMRL